MKQVFADAWFYIALLDADDQGHAKAAAWLYAFQGRIVTTRCVLTEVANSLAAPALRGAAAELLRSLESAPQVRIIDAGGDLYVRGLALYGARSDKSWSLTDCISFVAMNDERLSEALTADHHFHQAGFTAVFL